MQPNEFDKEEGEPMKVITHEFRDTRRPLLTEEDLLNLSVNIYQGPSAHDMMDRRRASFRRSQLSRPTWLLVTGLLLLAAATGMFVEIMRGLQP